jgi:hypothetical protein
VALCDIERYFDDHVTAGVDHSLDARANVLVTTWDDAECKVDLRDIILLASAAPGVKLDLSSIVLNGPSLKLKEGSAWHSFLSKAVSKIDYYMLLNDPDDWKVDLLGVVVHVKQEHIKDWMRTSARMRTSAENRARREWGMEMKLRPHMMYRLRVKDAQWDNGPE